MIPHPINPLIAVRDPKGRINGDDLAGAVWLSMPEKLYNQPVSNYVRFPMIATKVPMAFVYGVKDEPAAKNATKLLQSLKAGGKAPAATLPLEIKDSNAAGVAILGKEGVEKKLVNYLNKVLEKRAEKPWSKREVDKLPPLQLVQGVP
jgi:hypothetical protein